MYFRHAGGVPSDFDAVRIRAEYADPAQCRPWATDRMVPTTKPQALAGAEARSSSLSRDATGTAKVRAAGECRRPTAANAGANYNRHDCEGRWQVRFESIGQQNLPD